jgi:hypothetical protein
VKIKEEKPASISKKNLKPEGGAEILEHRRHVKSAKARDILARSRQPLQPQKPQPAPATSPPPMPEKKLSARMTAAAERRDAERKKSAHPSPTQAEEKPEEKDYLESLEEILREVDTIPTA